MSRRRRRGLASQPSGDGAWFAAGSPPGGAGTGTPRTSCRDALLHYLHRSPITATSRRGAAGRTSLGRGPRCVWQCAHHWPIGAACASAGTRGHAAALGAASRAHHPWRHTLLRMLPTAGGGSRGSPEQAAARPPSLHPGIQQFVSSSVRLTVRLTRRIMRTLFSTAPRQGSVPKWPTGADCKSAGSRLRWFESSPAHHPRRQQPAARAWQGIGCWLLAHAHVAQLAEHVFGKDEVTGSSPVVGSRSVEAWC